MGACKWCKRATYKDVQGTHMACKPVQSVEPQLVRKPAAHAGLQAPLLAHPAATGAAVLPCRWRCCWPSRRCCSCSSSACRNSRAYSFEMGSTLLTLLVWLTPYTLSATCTICSRQHQQGGQAAQKQSVATSVTHCGLLLAGSPLLNPQKPELLTVTAPAAHASTIKPNTTLHESTHQCSFQAEGMLLAATQNCKPQSHRTCGWKVVMMNMAGLRSSSVCARSSLATVVRYCGSRAASISSNR